VSDDRSDGAQGAGGAPQTGPPEVTPSPASPWEPSDAQRQRMPAGARRGGAAFGLVLIAIGVVMLFGRFVPWLDVVRLWPLIVIVSGIFQIFRRHGDAVIKRVAEGAGTVAVGVVLLGNSFGVISWAVWWTMLSLWPLLLVALGIEVLGRGLHLNWVRALSNVVLIAGLVYGVFVLGPAFSGGIPMFSGSSGGVAYQASTPHDTSTTSGAAGVKVGAIRLSVGAGDQLAAIAGEAPVGNEPALHTSVTGGVADVTVSDPAGRVVFFPSPSRTLALALDRAVTWRDLRLDVGAAEAEADLRDLAVGAVDLNVGASNVRLWIGKKSPDVKVDVSGGVTAVTVMVPADAAVTVDSKSGLSAISVPATFAHLSGVPAFGESRWAADGSGGPSIAIAVSSGMSSLSIETY
jgi:hypothetical protein